MPAEKSPHARRGVKEYGCLMGGDVEWVLRTPA